MTFLLSKLLWMIAQPSNFLLLVAFACSLLALDVRRRKPGVIAALAMTMLVIVAVLPVGLWLRQPLEDRFPRPQALPDEVAGIIILGGAQQPHITLVRGTLALNDRAERLIEELETRQLEALRARRLAVRTRDLARARSVLTGAGFEVQDGNGTLLLSETLAVEAPDDVATLLVNAGTPPTRLAVEQENLEDYFLRLTGGDA